MINFNIYMLNGAKVFIKNRNSNEFLFHLRDNKPNIPNPNKWSLFGGGIEENEIPKEALKRELLEEIGINIDNLVLLNVFKIKQEVNKKIFSIKIHLFKTEVDSKTIGTLTEGQKAEWFTLDEILKQDLVPQLKAIITKYNSILNN
jgi:8-oxo-dGTP diphosphatase